MTNNESAVETDFAPLVGHWFEALNAALEGGDPDQIEDLFCDDAYWRDLIALTWRLGHVGGSGQIAKALLDARLTHDVRDLHVALHRTTPRLKSRLMREVVEAYFEFTTNVGTGQGVIRFEPNQDNETALRAWTVLTKIRSIHGVPVPGVGERHPGRGYDREGSTDNWADRRAQSVAYEDREPEVVIAGAGQSGLMLAAHLGVLGVDALIVEKNDRIGDNWRNRYHSLALHNPTDMVQLPYMPFPRTFPEYLPKDQFANWLEAYALNMNLNTWTSTEFLGADYDEVEEVWTVKVRRGDGTERTLHPRHVVVATGGAGGQPRFAELPGLEDFKGEVIHSSQFDSGRRFQGKNVVVVGVATSAHDIALDLYQNDATVTMLQRSASIVVSLETANAAYGQYFDGTPIEEADMISAGNFIHPLMVPAMQAGTKIMEEKDKVLLDRLRAVGMKLDSGIDGTGFMYKFFQTGGGYYIDVGASDVVARGDIRLVQTEDLLRLDANGAQLADGTHVPVDAIVMATGYKNQGAEAQRYFGDELAAQLGDVSRFGEDGELRNAWKPTAQKGLWFMISGVAQARTYSPVLALQLKAEQLGILPGYKSAK
ncbi:NAD(P)/FAD-dependent oxidoreductase [Nocardioides sp. WS12]|uniref:flavin-containing monooxygenase n=1 Tax=Nocardioides sp. WS12 TaxID=2486272 RepID=UPI0015FE14D4|nr:NAD(P)/FAD-dependent oxidoreductase [Nocardioides sp. WS12]